MSPSRFSFPPVRFEPGFTPFAEPSHEPRLALETPFPREEIIGQALSWSCLDRSGGGAAASLRFRGVTDETHQWLAVCPEGSSATHFIRFAHQSLFSGLTSAEAARAVEEWLRERADYGERPWFDGGERKGMRLFQVAYGQKPECFYGWTVIQPHWFEIHK